MSGKQFLSMQSNYKAEIQLNNDFKFNPKELVLKAGQKQVNENEMERKIDRSKLHKFQNKASGIILIKQDYKKLFYNPTKRLPTPLREVQILFYTRKNSEFDALQIVLTNRRIHISYLQPELDGNIIKNRTRRLQFETNQILFPTAEEAPLMLQKKIWIELNRLNRSLQIYSGDVVNYKNQKPLARVEFQGTGRRHEGWASQAQKFPVPTYNPQANNPPLKVIDPFTEIQYFYINFKADEERNDPQNDDTKLSDFVTMQVLSLGRIFDSIIEENVSLLKPTLANLESMPGPLRNLFECLQNLDIRHLPDFADSSFQHKDRDAYLNWTQVQFALHHSLVNPYGYSFDDTPLGILNHLYKMKLGKQYKDFKPFTVDKNNNRAFLSRGQINEEIYSNRSGYIRLELLPHQGLGPGSMAVLQIWPPYHCSSIHNHGDAFGLIKVLSGSIRVQNFSELAFAALQQKPYMENEYKQEQYTWLSELSFGIHRLLNPKPQTCITLQAYYHNEVTEEYFSVVKRNNGVHTYIEYYPQNDWVNYLAQRDNPRADPKDREFIKRVISKYGLLVNGRLDTSFQRMVLALKKEYEYYSKLLATQFYA